VCSNSIRAAFPREKSNDEGRNNGMGKQTVWTSIAVAVLGVLAAGQPIRAAGVDVPNPDVLRDLEYVPGGHERQKLDLYLPKERDPNGKPPLLVWVHGDKDPLVPHNQSDLLAAALRSAGVDVTFYTVPGGGHGGCKDPQVDVLVSRFFNKYLLNK